MKTNFKKTLAVLLAVLMLTSVFSVTAFAATYTGQILPGSASGVTLKEGITEDMLTITSSSTKAKLPSEAYFEREDFEQDGWTTTANGTGQLLKFGSTQTINKKKFYPHWKRVAYNVIFTAGTNFDTTDPNNYTDETMTQVKELTLKTGTDKKVTLPDAMYTRENHIQDGWTVNENGGGTKLDFGSEFTIQSNGDKLYPHWKQTGFKFIFNPGELYDVNDVNNYTDSTMTQVRELVIESDGTQSVVLPGAMYTREGYIQTGWSITPLNNGTGTKYDLNSEYTGAITSNVELYPFWTPIVYKVEFVGGAYGIGAEQSENVNYNSTVTAPGAIFIRDGYTQIGWSTIEDSEVVEVELEKNTDKVLGDTIYYPVWLKDIYSVTVDETQMKFGTVCVDYVGIAGQKATITNEGNKDIEYTLPVSSNYDIIIEDGDSIVIAPGEKVTIVIKPKADLGKGVYSENIVFSCSKSDLDVVISVNFKVLNHSYSTYKACTDPQYQPTYQKDGYKEATCLNGCGKTDRIIDEGSMKKFGVEYNDAVGLQSSYIHHRTVRFTAFGSGMDDTEDYLTTRYRPVSWYVDDTYNGEFTDNEFENGYDVTFTHTIFGEYTLTINYVEETKDAETGEWVATGNTDTKTFDYTVGTTEYEEQEIVRPNTILNIIFGLFAKLLELLGIGG